MLALALPVALLFVATTILVSWDSYAFAGPTSSARYMLAVRALLLTAFVAFLVLALFFRRRPEVHARWMICSAAVLIDPILNRITDNFIHWPYSTGVHQLISFAAMDLIIGALAFRDWRSGRVGVFAAALVGLLLGQTLTLLGWDTAVWAEMAEAFGNLPLGNVPGTVA